MIKKSHTLNFILGLGFILIVSPIINTSLFAAHKNPTTLTHPDFTLDTNSEENLTIKKGDPDFRYFSDPFSGLTSFIDLNEFNVDVITKNKIHELNKAAELSHKLELAVNLSDDFRGLFLHLTPKDGRPAFFNILLHNKSGNTEKEQKQRDQDAETIKKLIILFKTDPRYQKTDIIVVQADTNTSAYIPKEPIPKNKSKALAYFRDPKHFKINEAGITNLAEHLTPEGFQVTKLAVPDQVGIKKRENNMEANQQGIKWNTADPATKAMTFVITRKTASSPTISLKSVIRSIPPLAKPANQFGIDSKASDHNPTRVININGSKTITQPLINTFGAMGFQKEEDLYIKVPTTADEKHRIKLMKEAETRIFLSLILEELAAKKAVFPEGLSIEALQDKNNVNFSDYADFIFREEWRLIDDPKTLKRIIKKFSLSPEFQATTRLYKKERRILLNNKSRKEALDRILNKNYKIIIDKTENEGEQSGLPEKDELIIIKQFRKKPNYFQYILRNHAKQYFKGVVAINNRCLSNPLSESQEKALKIIIINDVNHKHPRDENGRLPATRGKEVVEQIATFLNRQVNSGFPEDIPQWNPRAEQLKMAVELVRLNNLSFLAQTENSSKKNLSFQKSAEKKDALQRDKTGYVQKWKKDMEATCIKMNQARKALQ